MTCPFWNLKEAAAYMGKHPETVRRWVLEGDLTAGKAGRDLRFRKSDVDKFMFGGKS